MTPASPAGGARLPRAVIVLGIIAFCVAVGLGVLIPVLPVFARTFGVGNFEIGAVLSAFALMRLVSAPFCARMIVRFGERLVLGTGMYLVAISAALAGLAQTYPQLLILRGIGGIGSAMFTVSAMTLLLASVSPDRRGRATGFFQGGFLIGSMAGPAVGGGLSTISLTAPFFFYAAALVVAGTIGLVLLRSSETGRTDGASASIPLADLIKDRRFQAACFANVAHGWTSFGVRNSLVPVLMVEVLHGQPAWTGIAFAVASVVQTIMVLPAARMTDTVGRRPAMITGCLTAAASALAIPFAPNVWVLVIILCVYGIGAAFLGPAPAAAVGDAAGGRAGRGVAIFSMCGDLGAIAGPLVAGVLADHVSYPVAFGVGALLIFAAAGLSFRMPSGR
ncbi:MFS transporter [Microlunatus parietis]|uniref:MFS family permease n=1 Tax=Microlunatus parietis TaxID=682979 RepID=A0A7Y9I992_9ACTN|nr:MFS transporter [Microlunatus parietis]NYE72368.1 MFS family permease [Microlunatus parietis]